MRSIEVALVPIAYESADVFARALFDETIAPAAAKAPSGYFPLKGDPERSTYFEEVGASQLTPKHFDFPGGGDADGLIHAMVTHWAKEGNGDLASIGWQLKRIVTALRAEAVEGNGDVDPYCYTMF